jgi:hypothetical protein
MSDDVSDKLDRMNDVLTEVRISQGRTEVIMEEHIRRTGIAEDNINLIREEMKPIKKHVLLLNILWKVAIGISSVALFLHKMNWFPFKP